MVSKSLILGAIPIIFVFLLGVLARAPPVQGNTMTVHIEGKLLCTDCPPGPLSTSPTTVQAQATGTSSLSGKGADTGFHGVPGFAKDECTWPVTGSISGTTITLTGMVTQSANPSLVGSTVSLTADTATGVIDWSITLPGGSPTFTFTGTGSVLVENG